LFSFATIYLVFFIFFAYRKTKHGPVTQRSQSTWTMSAKKVFGNEGSDRRTKREWREKSDWSEAIPENLS